MSNESCAVTFERVAKREAYHLYRPQFDAEPWRFRREYIEVTATGTAKDSNGVTYNVVWVGRAGCSSSFGFDVWTDSVVCDGIEYHPGCGGNLRQDYRTIDTD